MHNMLVFHSLCSFTTACTCELIRIRFATLLHASCSSRCGLHDEPIYPSCIHEFFTRQNGFFMYVFAEKKSTFKSSIFPTGYRINRIRTLLRVQMRLLNVTGDSLLKCMCQCHSSNVIQKCVQRLI